MDNRYVIHDAEKEKPERVSDTRYSIHVLGEVKPEGGLWPKYWTEVVYDFHFGEWNECDGTGAVEILRWTPSLPSDPPKPRRWVKKEIQPNVVQVKKVGPGSCDVFAEAYGLPKVRNVTITYEIEEDQP